MKKTLCLTFTLLTFVSFAFWQKSFAQENRFSERLVRVIYFLPNDRHPQPEIDAKLDSLLKEVQAFYADEMERHGFGRKTFRLETDQNGDTIVHHVRGRYNDAHYRKNTVESVIEETAAVFDSSKNIYFYAVDVSDQLLYYNAGEAEACGQGTGGTDGGTATLPASGACFVGDYGFGVAAHELGHAFGLNHDFDNDAYIMSYGASPWKLSACHAEWLSVHRYFNTDATSSQNRETRIRMLAPEISAPYAIRLRFEINDPDGLHQAQLLSPGTDIYEGWAPKILDCISLDGDNTTVEFISTELATTRPEADKLQIMLHVIDVQGNMTWEWIDTPMTLEFPLGEGVSITDVNLAAAVREALGFPPNTTLTQRHLLKLTHLEARNKAIGDISGLQHAKHLKYLDLSVNEITDITPLREMNRLKALYLSGNQITDIESLRKMTRLTTLDLSYNPIQKLERLAEMHALLILRLNGFGHQINDVNLFANLTQLRTLSLVDNEITDITPLTGLTRLRELEVSYNPIRDLAPLREMNRLEVLGVAGHQINDVNLFADLTQLQTLFLYDNEIADITPLEALTYLTFLELSRNQIKDITPLTTFTQLKFLYLSDNQISNVRPLAGLVNLQHLDIADNPIDDRDPLLALLRKNPEVKIYLKHGSEPLPVSLSHFRAEHTDAGVILKWTTESEVDNAGFYLYRSETKAGDFKRITPRLIEGAGTTSQRNTYTWRDTTAKENRVYYYRIEDVSHAGVRKPLATMRMRGLISASGKMTTMWADVKAKE